MNYSIKDRAFVFGTLAGFFLFAAINVWKFFASHCYHCAVTVGFPLPVRVWGFVGGPHGDMPYDYGFMPENLIANLIIIGLSCLGLGLCSDLLYSRSRSLLSKIR